MNIEEGDVFINRGPMGREVYVISYGPTLVDTEFFSNCEKVN